MKLSPGSQPMLDDIVRLAGLCKGMSLVDMGCGDGDSMCYLAEEHGLVCLGIDRYAAAANPVIMRGDIKDTGLCPDSYDAVLFECTLSLTDDMKAALAESARLLKDGGKLIISDLVPRKSTDLPVTGLLDTAKLDDICGGLGLRPFHEERRDGDLDAYAAQLILDYGSFDAFLSAAADRKEDGENDGKKPRAGDSICAYDFAKAPGYVLKIYRVE